MSTGPRVMGFGLGEEGRRVLEAQVPDMLLRAATLSGVAIDLRLEPDGSDWVLREYPPFLSR